MNFVHLISKCMEQKYVCIFPNLNENIKTKLQLIYVRFICQKYNNLYTYLECTLLNILEYIKYIYINAINISNVMFRLFIKNTKIEIYNCSVAYIYCYKMKHWWPILSILKCTFIYLFVFLII